MSSSRNSPGTATGTEASRELEAKIERAQEALIAQLAEERSTAAAGVATEIHSAKTEIEDSFGEQVISVRKELKSSK